MTAVLLRVINMTSGLFNRIAQTEKFSSCIIFSVPHWKLDGVFIISGPDNGRFMICLSSAQTVTISSGSS